MDVTSCLLVGTYYVRICLHHLSNSVVISFVGSVTLIDSAIGLYPEIVVGSFTLQKM
jgi:hypothetical protein